MYFVCFVPGNLNHFFDLAWHARPATTDPGPNNRAAQMACYPARLSTGDGKQSSQQFRPDAPLAGNGDRPPDAVGDHGVRVAGPLG
jgi:hypothetical protein